MVHLSNFKSAVEVKLIKQFISVLDILVNWELIAD